MGRIKTWDELTICDNFLFLKVMQNKRICKKLIEKILGIRILRISYPVTEKSIDIRYDSKSVRLDVFVEDNAGTLYDIEMQTSDGDTPDELPKRARYYQAMMDMDVLNKSEYYTKLRKSFVIFICTFDPFGAGKSIYTFRETCQEDPSLLMGDETTKIFLNSQGNRDGLDPDITAFLDYVNGQAARMGNAYAQYDYGSMLAAGLGTEKKVIIDRKEGDYYIARSQYCSPEVDPEVLIPAADRRLRVGSFHRVRIVDSDEFDLYAELADK